MTVGSRKGQLALYTEADLDTTHPEIVRAIVVFHGFHRNSAGYLHDVEEARTKAALAGENSLLIAPQFLNEEDARADKLSKGVLRWQGSKWEGGDNAIGAGGNQFILGDRCHPGPALGQSTVPEPA